MSALTNYAEDLVLAWLFNSNPLYVALHDDDPGETGANEITTAEDADYVRKSITFDAPVSGSGQVLSNAQVSWTVNSASAGFTVTHASIWDAATSGNCLIAGELAVHRTLAANGVLTFEIGEIIATAD